MHELSIAMSLVDIACEELAAEPSGRIAVIHLRLGTLAGVVKEPLLFSFEVAAAGTAIEGAQLLIEDVPVTVSCQECGVDSRLDDIQHFHCPACGAPAPNVITGREIELFAMEIDEDVSAHN